jgi:Polyketide cyclase / dehydrase and lipid transport
MIHSAQITVDAPAATVFDIYRDVERWHTWDPDTKAAQLHGPFVVGTKGRLVPSRGRAVPMELVEVTEGRSFTVECRVPLFCMRFVHELTPEGDRTQVEQRLQTSGPLRFLLDRIIGPQVREGFPRTLASLKRLAQARYREKGGPG